MLLSKLTDEVLMVANDAIEVVAAHTSPKPSGKALLRLLAWVVADARGATMPMEKPLAETVGKRLNRQASSVSKSLQQASTAAGVAREMASRASQADSALRATLRAELAAIDEQERRAYQMAAEEEYVGFHELAQLCNMPPPPARVPAALAAALAAADQAEKDALAPDPPAIPQDLAQQLGRDGVQALWAHRDELNLPVLESSHWRGLLPGLVNMTLARYAVAYDEGVVDALRDHIGELTEANERINNLTKIAEDAVAVANEYALRLFGPGFGEDNEHV
jgi:hypothetical protein